MPCSSHWKLYSPAFCPSRPSRSRSASLLCRWSARAMLYGPVWGAVAGGLADFIGAVLFPIGPYFPGFTLTNALIGLVFGLFLRRRTSGTAGIVSICAAVLINNLVLSLLLNTLWVSVLYGSPFLQLLPVRLMQNAVMIPIEIVVIIALRHPVASLARSKAV